MKEGGCGLFMPERFRDADTTIERKPLATFSNGFHL
jgi:hypothetical protein